MNAAGSRVVGRVGTDVEYAAYVMIGTGLYGPKRHLIRPVSKKVLSWVPRTAGQGGAKSGRVFARYVRGVKPRPFLVEALEKVSPWPVDVHMV